MLGKWNLQKHRYFFIFLPIFLIKLIVLRYFLYDHLQIFQSIWLEMFYFTLFPALIELIAKDRVRWVVYILLDLVITTLIIALVLYYDYSGHVVTLLQLSHLNQVGTVKQSVYQLINPIYIIFLFDLIILLVLRLTKKIKIKHNRQKRNWLFMAILFVLSITMILIPVFQNKNEIMANSTRISETQGIMTYEVVSMVQHFMEEPTLTKAELKTISSDIRKIKGITPIAEENLKNHGTLNGRNVIYIQMEAFQNILINLEIDGQAVTPFLNDFVKDSLYFSNIYQQIAVGTTSDAEFMSNTSLYPYPWEATSKVFGDREIPSFPKLLEAQGYTTMTMHVNEVSFWNRDDLYPALGFSQYYDKEYFGEEDIVGIGTSDKAFFEKAMPILKDLYDNGQSFYAQLVTLSSHHPFGIPEEYQKLSLPEEYEDSIIGNYLQAAHYVDEQLETFMTNLKSEGILDNTVVVLYGDHLGLQSSKFQDNELELMNQLLGHDYSFIDQYNIPLIMHAEGSNLAEEIPTSGGQLDILPTVSNLLGLSLDDYVYFGQDLLNYPNNLFGMRYYLPYGTFFQDDVVFVPNTGFNDGELYQLSTQQPLKDKSGYKDQYNRIMKLLDLNDKYLNTLPFRNTENDITKQSK